MFAQTCKLISSILLFAFISGCASNTTQDTVGFLGNYDNFVDSKKYKFTKVYSVDNIETKEIASVSDIHLTPFELWLTDKGKANFNPTQLARLSHYFHLKLSHELQKKGYVIVDTASPHALTVRGAFSNITLSQPELSATDFIPFRIVLNAGNAAYLKISDQKDVITSISIEVEFLQGKPQKRVFAMVSTKNREHALAADNSENIQSVKGILDTWAINFSEQMSRIKQ
jgi:hypothetical protein